MNDQAFLGGGGEMGGRMRAHDWSTSPLGEPSMWPQSLRSVIGLMLNSRYPMFCAWGPELAFLYNDGYIPIFGAKHPHTLGLPFKDVWADIWSDIEPLVASAMLGQSTYHENFHLVMERNGYPEDTWYDFSYSPILDDDDAIAGMFCACTEKTAQILADRALRESEGNLRAVFAQLSEGVIIADTDGKLALVNRAAERIHGVASLDVTPDDYSNVYHLFTADGRPYPPAELPLARAVLNGEAVDDARWRIRRPDGSEVLAIGSARPIRDDDGRQIGSVLTLRDDTPRYDAELALRESEARFRNLADQSPMMVWVTDPDGSCTFLSRSWYEFTGQREEQALGIGWLEAVHPDDREMSGKAFVESNAAKINFKIEYRLRGADGQYRWAIDAATPLFGPDGGYLGYVGSVVDIDEQKQIEAGLSERVVAEVERRAKAEQALFQSQKMETIGQLTGGIAHDFNNLLQIITGNLDIIRRTLPDDLTRQARAADQAMKGADRAAVLTQRLLAFARRQPLAPKVTDANKLVSGMSEMLHRTLGENFSIETILGSGVWQVEVDPNQLESALLNLAVNARDAMAGGGKLTIETSNTHIENAYSDANSGVSPGQYAMICVSDTGGGMDSATVERAVEPFFTTKEVGKGTGLGLSMVYGFVKQSGGHFKIYSQPGEGTTVKIYLPRHRGAAVPTEERVDDSATDRSNGETILMCEDDADVRLFTADTLRDIGYRVVEADSGEEALRLLDAEPDVALLFTDVVLPGMTGAELATRAKVARPGLPILYTTGYARNAIDHHGRLDVGVELLSKPFTRADLAQRIRDLIDVRTN